MYQESYFYQFLEPISKDLARLAKELEKSIFTGPRVMLTHSRVFIEHILKLVINIEKLPLDSKTTLIDQIQLLHGNGYLTEEITDALHYVRKIGNQAAHDARKFRYSEALLAWEAVYKIVKWYAEVYCPLNIQIPEYQDPTPKQKEDDDIQVLILKLESLEKKLSNVISPQENDTPDEDVATTIETKEISVDPGLYPIRTIQFKSQKVEIPFFLRDAFLLPQRFPKSELFLIRLGAEQQARIMSELPNNLEGISKHVKRFNEKNEEILFEELNYYIKEEITRRKIIMEHPGELFIFFKTDYIILTENLSSIELKEENFSGIPNLLRQLQEDQIEKVGQLPKELVILAKYDRVGIGTVEKLFEQLKKLQNR